MNAKYIEALQDAIQHTHACDSRHVGTVAVREAFQAKIVWQGEVAVFDLIGHPQASQCFAWGFQDDAGQWEYVAVLKVGPVESPQKAIQAYVLAAQEQRKGVQ